jgi:Ni,Fe-hydrogenase III small subunit
MNAQSTEHTEHVHCCCCNACMEIPIYLLIDMELDARRDGIALMGLMCDVCL